MQKNIVFCLVLPEPRGRASSFGDLAPCLFFGLLQHRRQLLAVVLMGRHLAQSSHEVREPFTPAQDQANECWKAQREKETKPATALQPGMKTSTYFSTSEMGRWVRVIR